jgi:hypothetical protein
VEWRRGKSLSSSSQIKYRDFLLFLFVDDVAGMGIENWTVMALCI